MAEIELLSVVALLEDVPGKGLRRGQVVLSSKGLRPESTRLSSVTIRAERMRLSGSELIN